MFESVAIVLKPANKCMELAMKYYNVFRLSKLHADMLWVDDIKPGSLGKYDLIVAIGGDGTLLRISWCLGDMPTPILPIPCGRRTAFYEDLDKMEPYEVVSRILSGLFYIDRMDKITVRYGDREYNALNEVAILTQDFGKVLTIEISITTPFNKCDMIIEGDGVIISSTTGSSAYALSAGASIIEHRIQGIMFTPVNPMNLNLTPILFHPYTHIEIRPRGCTNIYVDGILAEKTAPREPITVYKAGSFIRVIRVYCRRNMVKRILATRILRFK